MWFRKHISSTLFPGSVHGKFPFHFRQPNVHITWFEAHSAINDYISSNKHRSPFRWVVLMHQAVRGNGMEGTLIKNLSEPQQIGSFHISITCCCWFSHDMQILKESLHRCKTEQDDHTSLPQTLFLVQKHDPGQNR